MFIQIIQGRVADPGELRQALESWRRELAPGAEGWLGTTAGVTADGRAIAVVRFASPEAAQHNSHRPEQHQWWMETAKLYEGDVTFHDCTQVGTFLNGGADDAGFVQILQGRSDDPQRLWALDQRAEQTMRAHRPEIIGGTAAVHEDGRGVTQTVYFTSEQAAREGERREPPAELAELYGEERELFTDIQYFDLTEPWLLSPGQ